MDNNPPPPQIQQVLPPPPVSTEKVASTEKFFNFTVEDLNELREKGKKRRHLIKDAKAITTELIKVARKVIQKAIEISKPGRDNAALLIRALRTDFRKDVFNILKAASDTLMDNFEENFSNKWVNELTNHVDDNENIYKNIMMERVAPVFKKIMGLMDPIQALNYTDDQKVELAIDASIAIPTGLFIASITMYSKSLPLVMRLNGLIPPTIIANFETTLSTIICIFNNLKKFEKLEAGNVEGRNTRTKDKEDEEDKEDKEAKKNKKSPTWESYGINPDQKKQANATYDQDVIYDEKIEGKNSTEGKKGEEAKRIPDFWQCDAEGLRLADQNKREIEEQYRRIKEGQVRKERADERTKKAKEAAEKLEQHNKELDEADGGQTERAQKREEIKKKLFQSQLPAAAAAETKKSKLEEVKKAAARGLDALGSFGA
jgi:hypothetical protein